MLPEAANLKAQRGSAIDHHTVVQARSAPFGERQAETAAWGIALLFINSSR